MNKIPAWIAPLAASLIFLAASLTLIPYPGLQNDEVFFAGPLYDSHAAAYQIGDVPIMLMSYSGALKSWIYAGLFRVFEPNVWSVRVPMVLVGIAVLWLTWVWIRQIANARAAAVGVLLLATDSIFLLTNTFDWGPVALQHLFLTSGLVSLQTWLTRGARWQLALAFFLWGVGMWDKALLSWPLIGLAAGASIVYPREMRSRLRPAVIAIALASFLSGAAPLIVYNLASRGETASANAKLSTQDIGLKVTALRATANGSLLLGYLPYLTPSDRFANPANWMLFGYGAALLLFATVTRGRQLLLLLIAISIAWLQMAVTRNTGLSAHHVILLWPLPIVFLAIAFSEVLRPSLLALAGGVLLLGNLLNTAQYIHTFSNNGTSGGWTDALNPLSDALDRESAKEIGLVDWGYLNGLRLLHNGTLHLFLADGAQGMTADGNHIFIQHTRDKQITPGVNDRLKQQAEELGYTEHLDRVINDSRGRPTFELFHLVKR